jgi:hypothetical protein
VRELRSFGDRKAERLLLNKACVHAWNRSTSLASTHMRMANSFA